jgi:DNA-binding transcriptional ArsR family regulator
MLDDEFENCDSINQEGAAHQQFLAAVNHPVRKAILEALRERSLTIEEIVEKTGLTAEALSWHLAILESGRSACIETENKPGGVVYRLTKAGRIIDYLE